MIKITEIDTLDAKIIYLLGKNSRLSYSALANAVRSSREVVAFRVNRLLKLGVISGGTVNVNFYRLGMNYFQILIRVRGGFPKRLNELRQFLVEDPLITSVQDVFGGWDYLVMARARTIHELARLLDRITSMFPEVVETRHYFVLDEFGPGWGVLIPQNVQLPKLPKDRTAFCELFKKNSFKEHSIIDVTDEKILLALGKDSRRGILYIAKDAGVAYRTAIIRIKRMIKEGVIQSFDTRSSLSKLGMSQRTALLRFSNVTQNEAKAREFFNDLRECSRYWRLLGPIQFRVNIYTHTTEEFEQVINKIRIFFREELLDIESMDILGQEKSIGFPSPLSVIGK